ncbi:Phage tail tube protein FII [compost metagenome]
MAARDVRKNLTINVDGRGYAGQLDEYNAPKLVQKVEEFRAGGMNAPIELNMGMEKLEGDFSLMQYSRDVLSLFGLVDGALVPITVRESLESYDGTVTAVVHVMRGKLKEVDPGTSKPGDLNPIKFAIAISYYRLTHGGAVVQEIDVENMIHIVNGVDVLAAQRAALGL